MNSITESPLQSLQWFSLDQLPTRRPNSVRQSYARNSFDAADAPIIEDAIGSLVSMFGPNSSNYLYLGFDDGQTQSSYSWNRVHTGIKIAHVTFFLGIGRDYHRSENPAPNDSLPNVIDARLVYVPGNSWDRANWQFVLLLDVNGVHVPAVVSVVDAKHYWDIHFSPKAFTINGQEYAWNNVDKVLSVSNELSVFGLSEIRRELDLNYEEMTAFLKYSLTAKPDLNRSIPKGGGAGVTKVYAKIAPLMASLQADYPVEYSVFQSVYADTGRTINGVKASTVFNAEFESVSTVEDLRAKLSDCAHNPPTMYGRYRGSGEGSDVWYDASPSFKEFRKASLKRNSTRAFNKLMEDFDFLNLDPERFPVTYQTITDGEIPISTFFRKKEQYFLLNDNFALWEEMLTKHKDVAIELAKAVSTRTTYEKDLMSYFYFVLYDLPEYLKKHTGEKWTCYPKLVNSTTELDPPKEDDDSGIVRKRSALTPIVDNDAKTVTVPYASLALAGRQTTYCYSHDYHVLRRGFSFNGNTVMSDVEEKLNGRDDYGLMFYTFTGSPQGRGYPTFLIIFERRSSGTHVHFHRTHPSRSKDGDYNPIHAWIKVCYNWMIGNVPRGNIAAQQGDLAFVSIEPGKHEFTDKVSYYDNHEFDMPVLFNGDVPAKQNILGYVQLMQPTVLNHHEHEAVTIPAGTFEIRQCRSWEANPRGIWTLRID